MMKYNIEATERQEVIIAISLQLTINARNLIKLLTYLTVTF